MGRGRMGISGAWQVVQSHLIAPIGPHDLLIAATALPHIATLVTRNTREFSRVAGLALVDWHLG